MNTIGKGILSVAFIAAVSGGVAVGTSSYLMNRQQSMLSENETTSFKQPVRMVNYASVAAENTDFTVAAESAVHGVVHIMATKNVDQSSSQNQYIDPFEYFFGFGGGNFQRPKQQPRVGAGSGVIISTDGYIITNNHVVDGADELEVTLNDNRKFNAKLIGTDPATDIALIKIEAKDLSIIPFGDSEKLKVGEWVLAVGNPFNLTSTVTAGIVSAKGRGISLGNGDKSKIESFIQTDAAVNPGNSGGALVNTKGELVGINTAIYSETGNYAGYSFAVPVSIASKVANDLKQYGAVQRAVLGVQIIGVGDIMDQLSNPNISDKYKEELKGMKENIKVSEGAYVADFADRSVAKEAGIEKGDVIVSVNDVKVRSSNALQEQISKYRPGDKVTVKVNRKGTEKTFNVELKNASGSTKIVKAAEGSSADVLGAAFQALSNSKKQELGVSYGIEVTGLLNGKLKKAGIQKGFIIMVVNDQKITTPEQLESMVDRLLKASTDERFLVIKGFYPKSDRTKIYAIDLSDNE